MRFVLNNCKVVELPTDVNVSPSNKNSSSNPDSNVFPRIQLKVDTLFSPFKAGDLFISRRVP